MPRLTDVDESKVRSLVPARLLVTGKGKTKKSSWIFESAAEHFNVIYLDMDGCSALSGRVPAEQRERFYYIPMYGAPESIFTFLGALVKNKGKGLWDEDRQRSVDLKSSMGDKESMVTMLDLHRADRSTILVIDIWTVICHAIAMQVTGAAFDDLEKQEYGANEYPALYNTATAILVWLKTLPCHVLLVAHEEEYIKYKPGKSMLSGGSPAENIEAVMHQPLSISKKHSPTLIAQFSQVLRFVNTLDGSVSIITKSENGASGGGALLAPASHRYNNYSFSTMAAEAGMIQDTIQPLDAVVRTTTLGEARSAASSKGGGATAPMNLAAFATKS